MRSGGKTKSTLPVAIALRESDSALTLDRLQAERTVRCGTRKNDGNGAVLLIVGEGAEEVIDRHPARRLLWDCCKPEDALFNTDVGIRRDDIDVIRQDARSVHSFHHGKS